VWDATVGLSVGFLGTATLLVLISGGVDVAFGFVVAGGASVAAVAAVSVSPSVAEPNRSKGSAVGHGDVATAGGASVESGVLHGSTAGEGGGKGLDLLAHLGDFGSGAGWSSRWSLLLRDVVGSVVSGRARGFEEFPVLVPFFKVSFEMGEGLGVGGHRTIHGRRC
jgi:ribose/xylose/arabinose/galactoside ABC-type transport system permease subunit